MAHYKKITKKLSAGDTVDYPSSGVSTSKLNVTAVSDEENPQYCLSSKDGRFNVNEYHSSLATRLNKSVAKEVTKIKKGGVTPREELLLKAIDFGIDHPKNIKTVKLEALIEAHKNGAIKEE